MRRAIRFRNRRRILCTGKRNRRNIYILSTSDVSSVPNLIKSHLTSTTYSTSFTLLQTNTLKTAAKATDKESIQASAVREVANQLLGNVDVEIASFSFDGDHAGEIILSSRYDDTDVVWDYSLDGGKTWTQTEKHSVKLTEKEIASITSEKEIKAHIIGADYSDDNVFTIDIQESKGLPTGLYVNDLENQLIGNTAGLEWKYKEKINGLLTKKNSQT